VKIVQAGGNDAPHRATLDTLSHLGQTITKTDGSEFMLD